MRAMAKLLLLLGFSLGAASLASGGCEAARAERPRGESPDPQPDLEARVSLTGTIATTHQEERP